MPDASAFDNIISLSRLRATPFGAFAAPGKARQMAKQIVRIEYLGEVETRRVAPTEVEVDVPDGAPQIRTGWGDRRSDGFGRYRPLSVYTDRDADGVRIELDDDGTIRRADRATCGQANCGERDGGLVRWCPHDHYPCDPPAWAQAVADAARVIRAAADEAERSRWDVAAVCESYRRITDGIAADFEAHERRWSVDAAKIARKFGRKSVEVGEQTVPGKCCVRSTRGTLLGYADVWDGKWLGTVQRIRRAA